MSLQLDSVFVPGRQASTHAFWIGLALIALLDWVRLSLFAASGFLGLLLWLIVALFAVTAMQNRLRANQRSLGLAFMAIGAGVIVKIAVAVFATGYALLPELETYLLAQNIRIDDAQSLNQIVNAPGFQQEFTDYLLANPDIAQRISASGGWPSHWGFWIVLGLFARQADQSA